MALSKIGKVLNATGAIRLYKNGDGRGFIWRWWHPLSWVLAPLAFLWCCGVAGIPEAIKYRHEAGLGIDPYFKREGIDPFK